jgi:hypothetical protein
MPPEGHYTKVKVINSQHGPGALTDGTGTFNGTTIMACGPFDPNDLPALNEFFNINGEHAGVRYEFPGYKCTHSGPTSEFHIVIV